MICKVEVVQDVIRVVYEIFLSGNINNYNLSKEEYDTMYKYCI